MMIYLNSDQLNSMKKIRKNICCIYINSESIIHCWLTCILRISSLARVRSASSRSKWPDSAISTPDSATPTSSFSRLSVTAAILSSRTGLTLFPPPPPPPVSSVFLMFSSMRMCSSRRAARPAPQSRVLKKVFLKILQKNASN